jgi:alpha-ketoglutarate-dependent taurine dioxygenase
MTRNIVGMDVAESDALLAQLFEHTEKPEFVYAHKWRLGDLLIWDNRCLNHARNDFPAEEIRHLRRVTISERVD